AIPTHTLAVHVAPHSFISCRTHRSATITQLAFVHSYYLFFILVSLPFFLFFIFSDSRVCSWSLAGQIVADRLVILCGQGKGLSSQLLPELVANVSLLFQLLHDHFILGRVCDRDHPLVQESALPCGPDQGHAVNVAIVKR